MIDREEDLGDDSSLSREKTEKGIGLGETQKKKRHSEEWQR